MSLQKILKYHHKPDHWFLSEDWDKGWVRGWIGALAFCTHWFLNPRYRSKPEMNLTWSLGWSWRMGWHIGRWSKKF